MRNVAKLLKLFPTAAPTLVDKPVEAYMADSDDCEWMVERIDRPRG